jgi:hypothetical protein
VPRAKVTLDVDKVGLTGDEIVQRLLDGDPAIAIAPDSRTTFYLNPYTLQPGEEKIVQEHLIALLKSAKHTSLQQPSAV